MAFDFPKPAQLDGDGLRYELSQAGIVVGPFGLSLTGDVLTVETDYPNETEIAAVVAAHTGAPSPEAADREARRAERVAQRGELSNVLAKARRVASGDETFTPARLQRLVGRLIIYIATQDDD